MTASTTHYEALGLAREAAPEDVKRAWARLVRLHTPDKDPEGNRRINEAKRILLDPQARRDYDALLDFGDEIEELYEEAEECEEAKDWSGAIRCYKEILAFHPDGHAARNRLALSLSYDDQDAEAARVLEDLVARVPHVALYWGNLGRVLVSAEIQSARAEAALRKAAELEPYNASHWVELSRLCRSQDRFDEAESLIEQAVGADGKTDVDDLDALFELPLIYLFSKQLHRLSAFVSRIQEVIAGEGREAAEFCSYRLTMVADELYDVTAFEEAVILLRAARRFDPGNEKLCDFANAAERAAELDAETKRLQDDESILKLVRSLAFLLTERYFGRIEDNDADEIFDSLSEAARTWSQTELRTAVNAIRYRYATVYGHETALYDRLPSMGTSDCAPSYVSSGTTAVGGGYCGAIVLTILLVPAIIAIFL